MSAGERRAATPRVFLGGSCHPTTWRRDTAIPILAAAGVASYDPQVEAWTPELLAVEARARAECAVLLFVIDGRTRAIASMLEVTESAVSGRRVLLVVEDIADGTEIDGQPVTGRELDDLNRARAYVRDLATRHPNATLYPDVAAAAKAAAAAAAKAAAAAAAKAAAAAAAKAAAAAAAKAAAAARRGSNAPGAPPGVAPPGRAG
jgi:hypothetical protein